MRALETVMMTGKKRLFVPIVIAALGLFIAAASNAQKPDKDKGKPSPTPAPTATPAATPCPLPENFGVRQAVSPEKPLQAVCHNGKILCVPQSAAQAHIQHGDTPLGPCSKQGNLGPCP